MLSLKTDLPEDRIQVTSTLHCTLPIPCTLPYLYLVLYLPIPCTVPYLYLALYLPIPCTVPCILHMPEKCSASRQIFQRTEYRLIVPYLYLPIPCTEPYLYLLIPSTVSYLYLPIPCTVPYLYIPTPCTLPYTMYCIICQRNAQSEADLPEDRIHAIP